MGRSPRHVLQRRCHECGARSLDCSEGPEDARLTSRRCRLHGYHTGRGVVIRQHGGQPDVAANQLSTSRRKTPTTPAEAAPAESPSSVPPVCVAGLSRHALVDVHNKYSSAFFGESFGVAELVSTIQVEVLRNTFLIRRVTIRRNFWRDTQPNSIGPGDRRSRGVHRTRHAGARPPALQRRGSLVHGNGKACYLLGEALRELSRYEEALLPLERSADLMPDDIHVLLALGWCYKRTGQLAKAIEALERAVRVDAGEAVLHYNLACYWSLARNRTLALRFLRGRWSSMPIIETSSRTSRTSTRSATTPRSSRLRA